MNYPEPISFGQLSNAIQGRNPGTSQQLGPSASAFHNLGNTLYLQFCFPECFSPPWLATTPEVRKIPSACLLRRESRRKLGRLCPLSLFLLETEDLPGRRGWWLGKEREAGWLLGTHGKGEKCRKASMRTSCGGLMGRKPMGYRGGGICK